MSLADIRKTIIQYSEAIKEEKRLLLLAILRNDFVAMKRHKDIIEAYRCEMSFLYCAAAKRKNQ